MLHSTPQECSLPRRLPSLKVKSFLKGSCTGAQTHALTLWIAVPACRAPAGPDSALTAAQRSALELPTLRCSPAAAIEAGGPELLMTQSSIQGKQEGKSHRKYAKRGRTPTISCSFCIRITPQCRQTSPRPKDECRSPTLLQKAAKAAPGAGREGKTKFKREHLIH